MKKNYFFYYLNRKMPGTNKGLDLRFDRGYVGASGQQYGHGRKISSAVSTAKKYNTKAKKGKYVTRGKSLADSLGATKELDKLTGGLFSRGTKELTSRGYGKRKTVRRRAIAHRIM